MGVSDNPSVLPEPEPESDPRGGRRQEGGFTLIEVMIAMLLLLVGVAGVLSLQMVSVRATSFSRHATEATIVAEDKMEELMNIAGSALLPGTDTVNEQAVDDATGEYTRTWTVANGALDPTVLSVTVVVAWLERGNENHSISIATQRRP